MINKMKTVYWHLSVKNDNGYTFFAERIFIQFNCKNAPGQNDKKGKMNKYAIQILKTESMNNT